MSLNIFDKLDELFDFCESAKGKFVFAVIVSLSFVAYSINNPVGTMAPGFYYFGVIIPTSLFLWTASTQENKRNKIVTIILGLAFLTWAIVNAILRG